MSETTKKNRLEEFTKLWNKVSSGKFDNSLVIDNEKLMSYLIYDGFFTAPASTKYHGAYEGGLYDHSKTVAARLQWLTTNNNLKWERSESPFIVGMFHDLCKCDQYVKADGERVKGTDELIYGKGLYHYEYNPKLLLKGHGAKSVMILSQFINLTEEELLCIRYHMGPYETEEWNEFDSAIRKFPNVFYTHAADMIASKIDKI